MEVFETLKADPSVIPNEFTYDALVRPSVDVCVVVVCAWARVT